MGRRSRSVDIQVRIGHGKEGRPAAHRTAHAGFRDQTQTARTGREIRADRWNMSHLRQTDPQAQTRTDRTVLQQVVPSGVCPAETGRDRFQKEQVGGTGLGPVEQARRGLSEKGRRETRIHPERAQGNQKRQENQSVLMHVPTENHSELQAGTHRTGRRCPAYRGRDGPSGRSGG